MTDLKTLAAEIKRQDTEILANRYLGIAGNNKSFVCPECGNGTGKDGTGMEIYKNKAHEYRKEIKCHKCGLNLNNLELIAKCENLDLNNKAEFTKAVKIGCEIFNISTGDFSKASDKNQISKQLRISENSADNPESSKVIETDIVESKKNLHEFIEKQGGFFRGLKLETLSHFNCGYLSNWISPQSRLAGTYSTPTKRLIIPTGLTHYLARLIDKVESYPEKARQFIKPKQHAGHKKIFGIDLVPSNADLIVVVEGEIDAMSIYQATAGNVFVIAIGGAGEKNFIYQLADKFPEKPNVLLLFDCDKAGRDNAPKAMQLLKDAGFNAVYKFLFQAETKADFNDMLIQQGDERLGDIISVVISDAHKEFELQEKIKNWQEINGEIDPKVLEKLHLSVEKLKAVTVETITAETVQDSATLYAVAQCKYYDFYSAVANNFVEVARKASGKFPAVSITEINKNISAMLTKVKVEHKEYLKKSAAEKRKEEVENRIAESVKQKQSAFEELEKLQGKPESEEKIISLINSLLEIKRNRNGKKECAKATTKNLDLIFTYDPNLSGGFGYDEFQQAYIFLKKMAWHKELKKEWRDSDESQLRIYIARNYQELTGEKKIADTFKDFCHSRTFHPIKQFFDNLPQWDNKPRAEKFFVNWLNVSDTEYSREVTIKWLLGAMARIYNPGCTFQIAVVLAGKQGIGKSYTLEMLGGKWYAVLSDRLDDPHAIDALQVAWLFEIKEFAAASKVDVNNLKSFIDRSFDTRRAAYERYATNTPRHNVFAFTTNNKNILRDPTGNRRFPILECGLSMNQPKITFDGEELTPAYIYQVWAEVKVIYAEMFKDGFNDKLLQLSYDNKIRAEELAQNYMQADGVEGEVQAFLNTLILPKEIWELLTKNQRREFFKNLQVQLKLTDLLERCKELKRNENQLWQALNKYYNLPIGVIPESVGEGYSGLTTFRGKVLRNYISAGEIKNECFGDYDRRISTNKVNEVLDNLEGWSIGKRIQLEPAYGDMKKVYYREESPAENFLSQNKETIISSDDFSNDDSLADDYAFEEEEHYKKL